MSGSDFDKNLLLEYRNLMARAMKLSKNKNQAEDLVQETMAKALAARHTFTEGTNFGAWLHTILRNLFLSSVRREKLSINVDDVSPSERALVAPAEVVTGRMEMKEVADAISQLPKEYLEPLLMIVVDGMTYDEISSAIGCSGGTTKSRVYRARRQVELTLQGIPRRPRGRPRKVAA